MSSVAARLAVVAAAAADNVIILGHFRIFDLQASVFNSDSNLMVS
jgi:hypothetical protein